MYAIEAAEVRVYERHSGTLLWLQGPATGVPGGGAWLGAGEKVLMSMARISARPSRGSWLSLKFVRSAAQT
jgi:hypothetical protein